MAADLVPVSARALSEIAPLLSITHHETGARTRWQPNGEQVRAWQESDRYRFSYILKPRQIGISTSECLRDVVWTAANAARGTPVQCWLVWDTDGNALEKLALCEDFALQLRIPHRRSGNKLLITTPGSAQDAAIVALTAGGRRVGASRSCHRLHLSELPNWRDAAASFTSLRNSLVLAGHGVIETTMLLGQDLPRTLWYGANDWHQVFFGVESHEEYRRPESEFRPDHPDLPESKLRELGFTRRDTMAYIQWALENLCDGDLHRLGREYPVTPEMAFASAEGRWVRIDPKVTRSEGLSVDGEMLRVFVPPTHQDYSGQSVIGVDTAGGLGRDRSAVAVVDKKSRKLLASYVSDTCDTEQLTAVALAAQQAYTRVERQVWGARPPAPRIPLAVIEDNGIGQSTCQEAVRAGLVHQRYHALEGTTYTRLLRSKRAVEAGEVYGPPELVEECGALSYTDGKFRGVKDLLVAIGIALVAIEEAPYVEPPGGKSGAVFRAPKAQRRGSWSPYK